ncbi:phage tail tape measure protein [Deinococcus sp. PEB2-63]
MTTGGGFGGEGGDLLYTDVVARLDQKSFAQIEQEVEQAGQSAGKKGGRALSGAFGGILAGLPGLAATAAAAVGAALVGGLKASVDIASQARQGLRDMQAQLGITAQEAAVLGEQAKTVFANNFGDSLADANAMVIEVRRQMKGLKDDELGGVTSQVAALADTFETDLGGTAQAANTLMQDFGLTSQQALDFIAKGLQDGLNNSGDFLETITEYSTQFKNGGASAENFYSILATGSQGGVLGTDKAADAFKEFLVRIQDGSKATSEGLDQLGINQKKLLTDLGNGTVTAADAFDLVVDRLRQTKDSNVQMQAGVALLGTQFEDLGKSGALALDSTKVKMDDLKGSTAQVSERYNSLGQFMQGAWRQVLLQLEPVGNLLLDLANDAMPAVKAAVAQVGPVVTAVVKFLVDGFRQGRQVAGQFASEFGPQIERAVSSFRPVVQAIGPLFSSVFGLIRTLWETVLRPVFTAIAPLITGVVASVGNTLTLLVRIVTGVANAVSSLLRGDVGGAVNALRGIFEDGVTFVVRQIRNMGSTILGLIKNLAPGMADAAANVIRGLISGIEGGAAKAIEAARKLAGNVIAGVKEALNIRSPSRVMAEMGGYVSEGLANGIEKSSPKAQKAAAKLGKDTADAARKELEKSIAFDAWAESLRTMDRAAVSNAQATARAAGEADRYNAAKAELARRDDEAAAATKRATEAAKQHAEQLANNRKAITDGLKFDEYVSGLGKYTDAQLNAAKANAYTAGDGQRFNAVLAEQKTRLEATKAAAEAAAQALSQLNDAQIAAANSAYQRDPQGAGDAAFRQSFGVGDEGLIRSLAAITGRTIAQIRADVTGALDEAKRFAPAAAEIIARVWAVNLEQRRAAAAEEVRLNEAINASYEQQSNDRIALIKKRQEEADRAVPDFAGMQRELILLDRPLDGLIALATEYAEGTDDAAVAAQNFLAGLKGLEVQARATAAALGPVDALRTRGTAAPEGPVAARGTVNTTAMQADQARGALTAEAEAWRTRTEAQEYAAQAQEEYRRTLDGKTVADLESLKTQALQLGQMEKYAVLVAEITRLKKDQAEADKKAAEEAAKRAALELNGTNISGRFEKGKTEASDKAAGTILNTVEAIGALANPATYLAFILEKLNIVGTIFEGILSVIAAPLAALQEPLRLLGELIGALMVPNLQLLAAVLTPVVRVLVAVYDALAALLKSITFGLVDITRDKYKQSSAALAPAPAAPSTTTPATASGNNVVQIPTSQVTVIASPDWVPKIEAAADKMLTAGEYMAVLVREGIRIRTDAPAPTPAASGPGLAWDLRT